MSQQLRHLLWIMLTIAVFAGLQGGKYFMHNRMQEVGIAISGLLFIYGAFHGAIRMMAIEWWKWVIGGPGLALSVMVVWSSVFALKAGTAITPSLFASREFLLLLLAPSVYFLHVCGMSIAKLMSAILTAAALTLASYLFFYFRMDLESAYFSSDSFTHHLVTYDDSRGFRLKTPTYAMMVVLLASVFTLFGRASTSTRLLAASGIGVAVYIWSMVGLRAVAAGLLIGVLVYGVMWRRPAQGALAVVGAPVFVMLAVAGAGMAMDSFMSAHGAEVRLASFRMALDEFSHNWILGWGQSSGFTKTYQDLFGPKFFPSDLGIIGILFKYGIIGGAIYVGSCFALVSIALRAHWSVLRMVGHPEPLIQALVVFTTVMAINMILWPGLAYGQGLTMASIVVGLGASIRRLQCGLGGATRTSRSAS